LIKINISIYNITKQPSCNVTFIIYIYIDHVTLTTFFYISFSATNLRFFLQLLQYKFSLFNFSMDILHKHQIDHRLQIINLYHNQPFQTCPLRTNEQTSESSTTATSNDENKQLEPVVLYTHFSKDQRSDIQYVMKTTLSHISFQITNPTTISLQSDPFLIRLTASCHKKRTDAKAHRKKFFRFKGLQVLQLSNAYFDFRPSLQLRHIFTEGRIHFRAHISLRLTETAMRQQVRIRKGIHLGSLKPVLLSKHLTATEYSRQSVPSRNQPHQNTHSLTLTAPQQPSFSPGTQSG